MQTEFDSLYLIRVLFLKENRLHRREFWQEVGRLLDPYLRQAAKPAKVYPSLYDEVKKDYIEFDNLEWNTDNISKWTIGDNQNGKQRLENVEVFFPSPQKYKVEKTTPDIVIKAYSKATEEERRYECVFALLLKQEFLKCISEEETNKTIKKLDDYLEPAFTAVSIKAWAPRKTSLQYGESLQYFFPSEILSNGPAFIFREGYEEWKRS